MKTNLAMFWMLKIITKFISFQPSIKNVEKFIFRDWNKVGKLSKGKFIQILRDIIK